MRWFFDCLCFTLLLSTVETIWRSKHHDQPDASDGRISGEGHIHHGTTVMDHFMFIFIILLWPVSDGLTDGSWVTWEYGTG